MKGMYLSLALCLLVGSILVNAHCPKGCNGHGDCGPQFDCTCYDGYMGNGCLQRTCPFGYAYTATQQGDWNHDGDLNDNSRIPLSQTVSTYPRFSKTITFNGNLNPGEIEAGETIVLEGVKLVVMSHTSGTNTMDVDVLTLVGLQTTNPTVYRLLPTLLSPEGAWEAWPGDANSEEGHFYMECSNQGTCDRKTGLCRCFKGRSGSSCQHSECPKRCNGHGTCRFVDELRKLQPVKITACEVQGSRGDYTLTADSDCRSHFAAGDVLQVGDNPALLTVASTSHTAASAAGDAVTTITLSDPVPEELPYGTPVWSVKRYGMWDANVSRACLCDPRYTGADCSELKCPLGDDPRTLEQQWETQAVTVGGADPLLPLAGHFRLVFQDMYGEKWFTRRIPVAGSTDYSAEVRGALMSLPDDVIQDCHVSGRAIGGSKGIQYRIKFNGGSLQTATGNSGNLAPLGCDTRDTRVQMKTILRKSGSTSTNAALEYETAANVGLTASCTGTREVTLSGAHSTGSVTDLADGDTVMIGEEMRVLQGNVGTVAASATSFKVDRPFSVVSGQPLFRLGTAGVDYRRQVKFTAATAPAASVLLPNQLISIGGTEERMVEQVTVSSGTVTSLIVTQPWLTTGGSGSNTVYLVRHLKNGVECTASDVFPLLPASWSTTPVRGHVAPPASEVALKDSSNAALTATVSAGSKTVTLSGACATSLANYHTVRIGTELRVLMYNEALPSGLTSFTVDRALAGAVSGQPIFRYATSDVTQTLYLSPAIGITPLTVATGDYLMVKRASSAGAADSVVHVRTIAADGLSVTTWNRMDYLARADVNGDGTLMQGGQVFFYGRGTRESKVCSGRGTCNRVMGTCRCFKGYGHIDCSTQLILPAQGRTVLKT